MLHNPCNSNVPKGSTTDLSEIGLTSDLFKLDFTRSTEGVYSYMLNVIMVCMFSVYIATCIFLYSEYY